MTGKEAIKVLLDEWKCIDRNDGINCDRKCEKCDLVMDSAILKEAYNMAIKALEQEPCDDVVSRQAVLEIINDIRDCISVEGYWAINERLKKLPSVRPQELTREEQALLQKWRDNRGISMEEFSEALDALQKSKGGE